MRPLPALPLFALCVLAACATPREACERDAAAPYRAALAEQAENARDLARGYRLVTEYVHIARWRTCTSGKDITYPCFRSEPEAVTRRMPIDRSTLIKRQDVIALDLPRLRAAAERDVAQCRSLYPQES